MVRLNNAKGNDEFSGLGRGRICHFWRYSVRLPAEPALSSDQELPKPAEYGLKTVKAIRIETNSGRKLLAWWHKPQMPNLPTIVYFHGNAGHLGHRAEKIRPYVDAGLGMLLVSYSYNAGAGEHPARNPFMTTAGAQSGLFRNRKFQARASLSMESRLELVSP